MKTMEKLCSRFNRIHLGYEAIFNGAESYPGFYRVYIYGDNWQLGSWYTFETCNEFKEWMNGVILEGE